MPTLLLRLFCAHNYLSDLVKMHIQMQPWLEYRFHISNQLQVGIFSEVWRRGPLNLFNNLNQRGKRHHSRKIKVVSEPSLMQLVLFFPRFIVVAKINDRHVNFTSQLIFGILLSKQSYNEPMNHFPKSKKGSQLFICYY